MAKFLVVDDEPMTAEMLATFIKFIGHDADIALNCQQAWVKIDQQVPDAILLDIMLPDTNGLEMCRQLRAKPQTAQTPVVMVSAIAPPLIKEAEEAGANDYLVKPINIQGLRNMLLKIGIQPP